MDSQDDCESDTDTSGGNTVLEDESGLSKAHKLTSITNAIKAAHWTFEDFIIAWVGRPTDEKILISHARYRSQKKRRACFETTLERLRVHGVFAGASYESACANEIKNLISSSSLFGKYELDTALDRLDYSQAVSAIR